MFITHWRKKDKSSLCYMRVSNKIAKWDKRNPFNPATLDGVRLDEYVALQQGFNGTLLLIPYKEFKEEWMPVELEDIPPGFKAEAEKLEYIRDVIRGAVEIPPDRRL